MGLLDDIPGVKDVQLNGVALTRRSILNIVMSGATASDSATAGVTTLTLVPVNPAFGYVTVGTSPYATSGDVRHGANASVTSMPDGATTYTAWQDYDTLGRLIAGDVNRPATFLGGQKVVATNGFHSVPVLASGYDYNGSTTVGATNVTLADISLIQEGLASPDDALYEVGVRIVVKDNTASPNTKTSVAKGSVYVQIQGGNITSADYSNVYWERDNIGIAAAGGGFSFAGNGANDGITPTGIGGTGLTLTWQIEGWMLELIAL